MTELIASTARALLAAALILISVGHAEADCVGFPTLSYFDAAKKVFVADVRAASYPTVDFNVLEAYKGIGRGPTSLVIVSSYEGYNFRAGERVLVYVFQRPDGSLVTGCSPTRRVEKDDPELAFLRHLARREAGGRVEGYLGRFDNRWNRYPGVRITLRSLSGYGPVLSTITGPIGGAYFFEWVPPGNYLVTLEAPPGVKDQQRLIYVGVEQRVLNVPGFIISAEEHKVIAPRD